MDPGGLIDDLVERNPHLDPRSGSGWALHPEPATVRGDPVGEATQPAAVDPGATDAVVGDGHDRRVSMLAPRPRRVDVGGRRVLDRVGQGLGGTRSRRRSRWLARQPGRPGRGSARRGSAPPSVAGPAPADPWPSPVVGTPATRPRMSSTAASSSSPATPGDLGGSPYSGSPATRSRASRQRRHATAEGLRGQASLPIGCREDAGPGGLQLAQLPTLLGDQPVVGEREPHRLGDGVGGAGVVESVVVCSTTATATPASRTRRRRVSLGPGRRWRRRRRRGPAGSGLPGRDRARRPDRPDRVCRRRRAAGGSVAHDGRGSGRPLRTTGPRRSGAPHRRSARCQDRTSR